MTNGDKLRNMSDEELVGLILKVRQDSEYYFNLIEKECCKCCKYYSDNKYGCSIVPKSTEKEEEFQEKCIGVNNPKKHIANWLKSEASEFKSKVEVENAE